jgi:hypothetical protein
MIDLSSSSDEENFIVSGHIVGHVVFSYLWVYYNSFDAWFNSLVKQYIVAGLQKKIDSKKLDSTFPKEKPKGDGHWLELFT